MKNTFHLCIIIPAFNEASKLDIKAYREFLLKNSLASLLFVNDASTDDTFSLLEPLKIEFKAQVDILSNKSNIGKAESVRAGMLFAIKNIDAVKYAYLDADLATSLEECLKVAKSLNEKIQLSFGSRILTVDSNIQRKAYRHYIGRIVATAISNTLKLSIYDTQCGCKVFDKALSNQLFQEPFISKWLFDVELFFRTMQILGREGIASKIHEYPLKRWIDKGESKVQFSYFFKLWLDLFKIRKQYKGV